MKAETLVGCLQTLGDILTALEIEPKVWQELQGSPSHLNRGVWKSEGKNQRHHALRFFAVILDQVEFVSSSCC